MTGVRSFFRTFLLTALTTGIPAGLYYWFRFGSEKRLSSALWSGVIAGFLIGFVAAVVSWVRQNKVAKSPPVLTDEVLLRKERANYDGMGGWLYLTDRRLFFEGYPTDEIAPEVSTLFDHYHGDEVAHEVSISIYQISEAVISQHLGGIIGLLDVVLTDGTTKHFGTEDLAGWVNDISTVRQNYLDTPRSENQRLFQ